MASLLEELIGVLESATPDLRKTAIEAAAKINAGQLFIPNTGPQTDAWFCEADELFFGGGAGGGKSALLCGLAIECHTAAIIFRREYPQIKGLIDETAQILGTRNGYNGQEKLWKLPGGNELEFGSCQHEDDKEKYQGRPHDLKGFDEITHFTESQYRFLIGWNRPTKAARLKKQRCRVVATGNPPFTAEGMWVIKYWGAWLDPQHPRPAKPGELRWYIVLAGQDVEVEGPGPHLIKGKEYLARSRTFIPAKLEDNPDLMRAGYAAVIEGMPEPMRTMMREGRFDVGLKDSQFQVIPTSWIVAAQARWKPEGFKDFEMTAMSLDPAGGGDDAQELAYRHGGWYGDPVSITGEETADGRQAAAMILKYRKSRAPVVVDVGGGYGGAVTLVLSENGISYLGHNGAKASTARTKDGQLKFANKRAEVWWRFREALDPEQEGGSVIALPPSSELRADLAAPTYTVGTKGILIESKDELRKRLGRSPGKGDAVVNCFSEGNIAVRREDDRYQTMQTTANLGHAHLKRRR